VWDGHDAFGNEEFGQELPWPCNDIVVGHHGDILIWMIRSHTWSSFPALPPSVISWLLCYQRILYNVEGLLWEQGINQQDYVGGSRSGKLVGQVGEAEAVESRKVSMAKSGFGKPCRLARFHSNATLLASYSKYYGSSKILVCLSINFGTHEDIFQVSYEDKPLVE
jgi:hypothetical protein